MFVVGYCWEQKPRDKLYFHLYSTYICIWDSPHSPGATAPSLSSGPGPPHCRVFTIAPRHTTFSRIPLDEWSDRRRDLYLTASDTHKRQTSMSPAGFTRNPSKRAAADQHLRRQGQWDRLYVYVCLCVCVHIYIYIYVCVCVCVCVYINETCINIFVFLLILATLL